MKKEKSKELEQTIDLNSKLDSAIRILLEKLSQAGIVVDGKQIIIKNGELTIN